MRERETSVCNVVQNTTEYVVICNSSDMNDMTCLDVTVTACQTDKYRKLEERKVMTM